MYPYIWGIATCDVVYAIMTLVTTAFILIYGRKHQARSLHLWMFALIFLIGMTVGARALWAFVSGTNLFRAFIWSEMRGGLWGGQIAIIFLAFTYILIFTRKRGLYFDIVAISFSLGLFIAKLACFFNGCCYGKVTSLPWAISFPKNLYGCSPEPRHPTQLYDSASTLIIFIVLLVLARKPEIKGKLFIIFLLLYSITKFVSEFFRAPASFHGGAHYLSYSQIAEAITFVLAVLLLTIFRNLWQKILATGSEQDTIAP